MKYMLLIYLDEQALSESEREQCYQESPQLAYDIQAAGQYLAAAPLHPTSTATSVRVREGRRLVTDGPFAETREQLGGYFLSRPGISTRRSPSPRGSRWRAGAPSKSGRSSR